jgi:hypothetical protein
MLLGLQDTEAHSNHLPNDMVYHPRELLKPLIAHNFRVLHQFQEKPLPCNYNTLTNLCSFLSCCMHCLVAPDTPQMPINTYQAVW